MSEIIIDFQNISKGYGNKQILQDFNLQIAKEEFLVLIGTSGCGKTTVLKLINGLLSSDQGKMIVHGDDVAQCDGTLLRRNIGYVIQGIGLFPHLSVRENMAYVLTLDKQHTRDAIAKRISELMEIMQLEHELLDRYPSELSGGQKQRVGIARALAAAPSILLMDEPFGAVDEITRRALQKQLQQLHQRMHMTIVFVTHDIKEALRLGTRILVMDQGVIVQDATPEELRNDPATDFVKQLIQDEL